MIKRCGFKLFENGIDVIARNDFKSCAVLEFRWSVGIEVAVTTTSYAIGNMDVEREHSV